MIRKIGPSLFTRALAVPCLVLLVGCGASNNNSGDTIADAATRADVERSLVSDAPTKKDVEALWDKDASIKKDTAPSVTPEPDAAQPRADLAIPDANAGREAAPLPTDTMANVDSAPMPVDTAARGDAVARTDTQTPDGPVKGPDGAAACNPVTPAPPMTHLSPKELKAILDSSEDVYLINVKGSSIANIPGTDAVLASNVPGIEDLVGKNLCANIILYCRSGATSQNVGDQLVAKGYQHVRDLSGGINAWTTAGYATE